MIYSEVIIVGGGPAGSTCAWKLKQNGIECLILDKQEFPRTKLCAGWITPNVVKNLKIDIKKYPHSFITFDNFHLNIFGRNLRLKTLQYSIRRYEFDGWLLKRSAAPVYTHNVNNIKKENDCYIIDDKYCCKYLIGAGGTFCPVYKTYFKKANPRPKESLIVTLEEEFAYDYHDKNCRLWFFDKGLPGYSWYVPKGNKYLNIGIGGLSEMLKRNKTTIRAHWNYFIQKLEALSLIKNYRPNPKGLVYYQRDKTKVGQIENAFIIGDAKGLATRDWGEGIGPAVESGILVAKAIINGSKYSPKPIKIYSSGLILKKHFNLCLSKIAADFYTRLKFK